MRDKTFSDKNRRQYTTEYVFTRAVQYHVMWDQAHILWRRKVKLIRNHPNSPANGWTAEDDRAAESKYKLVNILFALLAGKKRKPCFMQNTGTVLFRTQVPRTGPCSYNSKTPFLKLRRASSKKYTGTTRQKALARESAKFDGICRWKLTSWRSAEPHAR